MAVKAISEFHDPAGPTRRVRASVREPRGATIYVALDDSGKAVEISEWESAEAREKMAQSEAMAAFAPLFELLAAPPRAIVVGQLHSR